MIVYRATLLSSGSVSGARRAKMSLMSRCRYTRFDLEHKNLETGDPHTSLDHTHSPEVDEVMQGREVSGGRGSLSRRVGGAGEGLLAQEGLTQRWHVREVVGDDIDLDHSVVGVKQSLMEPQCS